MSETNWYVVHTYSGYENKVKANIEKTIENRHLEDQILEVRVPLQEVVEMKNGAAKQVQKKMFPGYVLINMVMNDDTWYVVRNTRGVTGFVGPGSKPVPLTDEEMRPLGIREETVQVDFAEGDMDLYAVWERIQTGGGGTGGGSTGGGSSGGGHTGGNDDDGPADPGTDEDDEPTEPSDPTEPTEPDDGGDGRDDGTAQPSDGDGTGSLNRAAMVAAVGVVALVTVILAVVLRRS